MKAHLLHGIIAGLLSGTAGIIYLNFYQNLYFLDYSLVINWGAILGSSMIGCILMVSGCFTLEKINKVKFKGALNLVYMLISFVSIIPAMTMSLPLEVDFPELFPGLVIPMHFFPAMIFFGLIPFFNKKQKVNE